MLLFLFQADIIDIIINVKFGMKNIPLTVNGNNTFAEVKEKLAAMEGIETDSISTITFQGRWCADDKKLKDISDIMNHNFYATRRLRGGGVAKRPRAAISMVEMKPMDSDPPGIKLLFSSVFNSVDWLGQQNKQQVTDYLNFLEKERNSERQKTLTIDFISEYASIKALCFFLCFCFLLFLTSTPNNIDSNSKQH